MPEWAWWRRFKDHVLPGPRSLETLEEINEETGGSVDLSQGEANRWKRENCPPHMWATSLNTGGKKCRVCGKTRRPELYAIGYEHPEEGRRVINRRQRLLASTAGTRARSGARIWEPDMGEPWFTNFPRNAYEQAEVLDEHRDHEHYVIHVEEVRDDGAVKGKVWEPNGQEDS